MPSFGGSARGYSLLYPVGPVCGIVVGPRSRQRWRQPPRPPLEHPVTDPHRLTPAGSTPTRRATASRPRAERPHLLHVLLWALLALSVTGNAAVSAGVGPSWLSIAFGLVTLTSATVLVRQHLKRR